MGSNHVIVENPQSERTIQDKSLQSDRTGLESDVEIRIRNMDRLVDSVHVALDQESFSGKRHALLVLTDLRVKIKATHNMFRLARLLREPARESMLSRVRDSLMGLEKDIAAQLHVEIA